MTATIRKPLIRYRFDRVGNVIRDDRQLSVEFGTRDYDSQSPKFPVNGAYIFAPRKSSSARIAYRAARKAARLAARNAPARAMQAVHEATVKRTGASVRAELLNQAEQSLVEAGAM